MKLAETRCKNPSCGAIYSVAVDDDAHGASCPVCGQINGLDHLSVMLTGRCQHCGKPLDEHFRNPMRGEYDYQCKGKTK